MDIGDKVRYTNGEEQQDGVIHAVKKADLGEGEVVIGYLIDTGGVAFQHTRELKKGKTETFTQPELFEAAPENLEKL